MIKIKVWRPKTCNCLFWAVGMQFLTWWQGRIVIVKSDLWQGLWSTWSIVKTDKWSRFRIRRNSTGFHVIWVAPDGQILSYSPDEDDELNKKEGKKALIFEGYIKKHPKSDIERDDDD